MKGRFGLYIVGAGALLALVGCGRSFLSGERAPWRHDAEVACMKSGSVKISTSVVRVDPIEGPGMCGVDFPLKVATLGESSSLVGYADDPRPPGSIPNGSAQMPRWPINEPQYAPPAPIPSVQTAPAPRMRWVPGPPPAESNGYAAPTGQPVSLSAPGVAPAATRGVPQSTLPIPDDVPDDAESPRDRAPTTYTPRTYGAPAYQPPQRAYETPANQSQQHSYQAPVYQAPQRSLPPLGPARRPMVATVVPATLTPPATLACPIVSALDRWVSDGVQPAAMRWFGEPVTEIKQISAYSCRGMVGAGGSGISEHAFGNALDIAAFTFSDGRRITVQNGWHGTPEEQGFLRDVHLAACNHFSTVLAPGYNAAHYNHIHVDLMRRASGDRPCRPEAITGEVAAAKARAAYASRQRGPVYTGVARTNTPTTRFPTAIPGQDGLDDILIDMQSRRGPTRGNDITGAIAPASAPTLVR
jgi:hypothetical protein